MACAHDHGGTSGALSGHAHGADTASRDGRRRVAFVASLTFAFMFMEVAGGIISGSLALLADAAHMLTDAVSLALAWVGYRLAARPADRRRTFGFGRYRILAAFVNGLTLLALALWISIEAIMRLITPHPVSGPMLLAVAVVGLGVNLVCFRVLHGGDRGDLNLRGALWHVVGDLLGSVAAILAALVIMTTGWVPIDPLLSVLVASLIALGGFRITREAGRILAEEAPSTMTSDVLSAQLSQGVAGLAKLSMIRIWSITETERHIAIRAEAEPGACPEALRQALRARLDPQFSRDQATIEVVLQKSE